MVRDVMVFTPVLRLEPETIREIFNLDWAGPLTVVFQSDNPTGDRYRDHLHQYQRGRELFLYGRYDAMLVIESDIIPPRDTLQRLAALDAGVAYGVYVSRSSHEVNVLELYYNGERPARNIGEPLSSRGLYAAAVRQGVVGCSGGGLGCLLIRRDVLEAVPFQKAEVTWFDNHWTEAVYRAGYRMMADTTVVCGHVDTDGTVLTPPGPIETATVEAPERAVSRRMRG